MDRKTAERRLIKVCWKTAVAGLLAYFLLQFIPSIRVGITLSIFGIGFIAFAWTGGKVGIAVWKIWPVYRSEQPGLFLVLLVWDVITGITFIVLGWGIQIYIVNAPPRANPLPPEHPDYENYQVGSLGKPESNRFIIQEQRLEFCDQGGTGDQIVRG